MNDGESSSSALVSTGGADAAVDFPPHGAIAVDGAEEGENLSIGEKLFTIAQHLRRLVDLRRVAPVLPDESPIGMDDLRSGFHHERNLSRFRPGSNFLPGGIFS